MIFRSSSGGVDVQGMSERPRIDATPAANSPTVKALPGPLVWPFRLPLFTLAFLTLLLLDVLGFFSSFQSSSEENNGDCFRLGGMSYDDTGGGEEVKIRLLRDEGRACPLAKRTINGRRRES